MKPSAGAETLLPSHARPLYDALPNPLWLVDASGNLTLVNRAWRAYTGRDEADVLGRAFTEVLHPGERAELLGRWQAAQGPGEEVGGDHRLRGAGGEYGWFALRARPAPEFGPGTWVWTAHELDREEAAPRGERGALERAYQDAELLAALAAALQGAATPEQVAEQALRLIGPALGASSMLVVRLDGEQIRLPTIWGDTPPVITAHMTRPGLTLAGAPLLARAAREGQGVYLADYRAEPGTLPTFPSLACGVEPIRTPGGTLEGFLVVWRPVGQQTWDPEERRLLRRAAGTLGLALERAAAAQRLAEGVAALDAFVAFSEAVGHETDVYALARRAGEVLRATLGGVSVAYYELEGGLWRARVWTEDIAPETVESITRGLPQDAPSFARAVGGREPLFVSGWDAAREEVAHTEAYGAVAFFPYFRGEAPRSLLAVGTQDARTWSERERAVVLAVGRSLGLSLERADVATRLAAQNAELEARARALEGFAELTRDLSLRADPHALVRRAQEVVLSLLPPGYALYYEREGDRWRNRVQVGEVGHADLQAFIDAGPRVGATPSVDIPWATRQPFYQDAYARGSDTPAELVQHVNAAASLPVLRGGEVAGVFIAVLFEERAWTRTDRVVLETVIRSLGSALEAAQGVADLARRTREVAEWRERYEVAVQGSGNVLYDWNAATGEMVYGGPLEEITGYTPGELARSADMWMETLVHPEDRAAFREEALRVIGERGVLHTGFRVRRKDGSVREVETDGHFVWNAQGEVTRMVGLIRDVTERREAEERLRRSNEELRRSNAELEQFAYVASHDLQAPLRAVTSFAELALRRYGDRLDERGQLYLRQIVENGQHMKRLVDDLLGFSRLNTRPRHPRAADAAAVFDGVARRLADEVEEAGGRLTRGPLPCVLADPARLDQLLQNLLSNALKYRREGVPPRVHVSARRDGERWRFAVRDNGIGIEPQYFERIFVIFQRLHGREEFDGTGIGLAVCKKIVEQHGGELWLESVPGEGTTFFFTLPACPPEGPGAELS
ncbi:PAS domain S-box [Deinococcus aerius]|uniref:histidine kinase n=1 Tax=Deinococcus aerius TaxID=200253 RepID=A0A2I9DV74_9DEIO|nr:ATP-binding protein [Deinococcus aerius]GBF06737.1 PAS domain S-box [Deinococcus aerius]